MIRTSLHREYHRLKQYESNEDSGNVYIPPVTTAKEFTFNATASGNAGYTYVMRMLAAGLTLPPAAITRVRYTFKAGAGNSLKITNCYTGHQASSGDVFDFDTTPVQVTFDGGNTASSVMTSGGSTASDWITFAYNKTDALLCAFYMGTSGQDAPGYVSSPGTNYGDYWKSGNDAATVNKSGYGGGMNDIAIALQKIEVRAD